jgi:type IV pilus assembly protein PilC
MLRIGTDLFKAIDILIADFDKPSIKSFLFEVRKNLEKGLPFYFTFEKHSKEFSDVFVNLIKAGESSGSLEQTFETLSLKLQKERALAQEIKSAVIYPLLLVVVSILVVFFLVSFAIPKIAKIFESSTIEPPLFSKIVFIVGDFLNSYMLLIIAVIIFSILAIIAFFRTNKVFKKNIQIFFRKLPVIGKLLKEISLQRFATTLSSLLNAGMPIISALEITAEAVGDEEIKSALYRISQQGISKGLTLGEAFKREPVFPKMVTNLIAISEKSGNLSKILLTLSDFYEAEIKTSIKILVSFLEPVLLIFIGIIVAVIALAIIVPVYQLVGQFK